MSLHDLLSPEELTAAETRLRLALTSSHVPDHLHEGLLLYISHGILPGSFLQAVLCNDLLQAGARADPFSRARLLDLFAVLYDYAPTAAIGSREKVLAWTVTPDRLEIR